MSGHSGDLILERRRKIVFTWITDESEEPDPCVVTLTIAYAALKVWAMDYAEGKSTGQVLTCPVAAG